MARHSPLIPVDDGPEFLDRDHGVDYVLRGDDRGEPGDAPAARSRPQGLGIRTHRVETRRGGKLVLAAGTRRHRSSRAGSDFEYLVRLTCWISDCLRARFSRWRALSCWPL